MTKAEREAFLADVHIGVLSVIGEGDTPLTAPIWYSYEPGGTVNVIIGSRSRKAKALAKTPAFSLCAQIEAGPYKYVTVEGPVTVSEPVTREERTAMAVRYLGEEHAARYIESTSHEDAGSIVVRMQPARWRTTDYGKVF